MGVVTVVTVTGGPLGSHILQLYGSRVLGLSAAQIGLALGLLILAAPAPFLFVRLARAVGKRRILAYGYAATAGVLACFLVLPPLSTQSRPLTLVLLVVLLLLKEVLFVGTWNAAWFPWMRELSDPHERGRFFARMRFSVQLFATLVVGTFSLIVGERIGALEYNGLLIFLIAYLVFASWTISTLPEPTSTRDGQRPDASEGSSARLTSEPTASNHRAALLTFLNGIQIAASVPMYALYCATVLDFSDSEVARLITLQTLAVMSSLLFFGRAIDRLGYARIITTNAVLLALVIPLWLVVPSEGGAGAGGRFPLVAFIVVATAALQNGLGIAALTALSDVVDSQSALASFARFNIVGSTAAYSFLALSGVVLANAALFEARGGGLYIDLYRALIEVGVLVAVAIFLIGRSLKPEPG